MRQLYRVSLPLSVVCNVILLLVHGTSESIGLVTENFDLPIFPMVTVDLILYHFIVNDFEPAFNFPSYLRELYVRKFT